MLITMATHAHHIAKSPTTYPTLHQRGLLGRWRMKFVCLSTKFVGQTNEICLFVNQTICQWLKKLTDWLKKLNPLTARNTNLSVRQSKNLPATQKTDWVTQKLNPLITRNSNSINFVDWTSFFSQAVHWLQFCLETVNHANSQHAQTQHFNKVFSGQSCLVSVIL